MPGLRWQQVPTPPPHTHTHTSTHPHTQALTRVVVLGDQPVLVGVGLQRVQHILHIGAQQLRAGRHLADVAAAKGRHRVHDGGVALHLRGGGQ
jgi:hypothetical protein